MPTMEPKKLTKKAREARNTRVCVQAIAGLQINIMDLSKVSARAEYALAMTTEAEAIAVVREYALTIAHVEPTKGTRHVG